MSRQKTGKAFLGALSAALLMGGAAAVSAQAAVPDYGPMIQKLSHQRLHLVKTVPTGVAGLTALLAETASGKKNLAFGLDGKYLIPGPVIGVNGKMLNTEMAEKLGLVPKSLPVAQVLNQAVTAPGFVLGHAGPMLVAFMDPNCIFCHKFYESVLPELKAGKLRVKVVPVAFLKPSSLPKAVAILSAKDPAKAWAFDEAHFNVHTEEGGITPAKNLKVPATARIEANTHLLARTGEIATPTVLVCRKDGKPVLWHGVTPDHLKQIRVGAIGDLLPTGSCRG
ncbi:thioredoxin fold domain-containing protein [Acidithiobacillus thiooxidans]|uniref:thioredoxin fold domain-containing protein n=1 Tax=Acidithiobacillus thiooxidans TaxID=930 RepID=UPI000553C947|nr:thioredoxin fold domain-containing protein [Acidithiobacillus thiooxidans]